MIRSRVTLVWMLLLAATVLSFVLGHGVGFQNPLYAGSAIIAIAFIKVRFVILDFMEIRRAPLWMRVGSDAWLLGIAATLIALYFSGHWQPSNKEVVDMRLTRDFNKTVLARAKGQPLNRLRVGLKVHTDRARP